MVALHLLGGLNLLRDGHEMSALIAQPKRLALLCYLALAPLPGFRRRDSIIALLWPELSDFHGRAALRQAAHVVRRALGVDALVSRGADELGVDHSVVWCDAAAFEAQLNAGRPNAALSLYAGPLLDGFFLSAAPQFEEWLEDSRAHLRARASRAAWMLAAAAERDGDVTAAKHWARRAHGFDPDDETALGALLSLLLRVGDRCGAMHEYERFARRMWREYQIAPSGETEAIIRPLRVPAALTSA
jgi:DNA-binding SARP family transcriptional activator